MPAHRHALENIAFLAVAELICLETVVQGGRVTFVREGGRVGCREPPHLRMQENLVIPQIVRQPVKSSS